MGLAAEFGRNVRRLRLAKGMTIEALANEIDLAYSYVGEIERGRRNPSLKVVERVAKALGVNPIELFSVK